MRRTFTQFTENETMALPGEQPKVVVVIVKPSEEGMGWEARFKDVDTTSGVGQTEDEAVKNLLAHPTDLGFEDWEREHRKSGGGPTKPSEVPPKPQMPF